MPVRHCALPVLVALALLAACGDGGGDPAPTADVAPAPTRPAAPPPPEGPRASRSVYLRALEGYCSATVAAIGRLADAPEDRRDPIRPIATFAGRYRTALDDLAGMTPPLSLRRLHLLTLAQGRESADRIDDGVRLGREGDIDAATTALGELQGLLPATLPPTVRRDAPACAEAIG